MKRLSLSEVTGIAEIVGSIGIIVSLIFVGLQVRQNTSQVEAASYQTGMQFITLLHDFTATTESAELMIRGFDDFDSLSRIDKAKFDTKMANLVNAFALAQQRNFQGTLSAEEFDGYERTMARVFLSPGVKQWWDVTAFAYPKRFQVLFKEILRQYPNEVPVSDYYKYDHKKALKAEGQGQ